MIKILSRTICQYSCSNKWKKRGLLKSERNTKQEEVEEMIKRKNISKYLTDQKIKKKYLFQIS